MSNRRTFSADFKAGVLGKRRSESIFSHLKTEMYYHQQFKNHFTARNAVMEYIESWYNCRPHLYNVGLTPAAALANYQARCQPAAA